MSETTTHRHEWTDWVKPAVLRDSFNVMIGQAGVAIRRLSGTDEPVTSGWWRTCRTCLTEQIAEPAAPAPAVGDQRLAQAWTEGKLAGLGVAGDVGRNPYRATPSTS